MSATRRMMTGRGRRVAAVAGAGAALVALAGCNPASATASVPAKWGFAKFRYDGPSGAWFEAAVSDAAAEGTSVSFVGMVHIPAKNQPEEHRCKDGVNRGVEEACHGAGEATYDFRNTDEHAAASDAPGTYWPMMDLRSGNELQVVVYCRRNGADVACPSTTKVLVRTVDGAGALVGDLTSIDDWSAL